MFHASDATLSFVGLPFKVVPFPLSEAQARLVAAVLSGRAVLPPAEQQAKEIAEERAALQAAGGRNLHEMSASMWRYVSGLYELAGVAESPRHALCDRIYAEVRARMRSMPTSYREGQYTLHVAAGEAGGGWFEVQHPTHPLGREDTEGAVDVAARWRGGGRECR